MRHEHIKAENLSVGDVMLFPFERTATITQIKPFGARATYVNVKTEHGWTKLFRTDEVFIKAQVHG